MITLCAGSLGLTQMAGSSAASPPLGTGSVSTVAVTISSEAALAGADATTGSFASARLAPDCDSDLEVVWSSSEAAATLTLFLLFLSLLSLSSFSLLLLSLSSSPSSSSSDLDFTFFFSFSFFFSDLSSDLLGAPELPSCAEAFAAIRANARIETTSVNTKLLNDFIPRLECINKVLPPNISQPARWQFSKFRSIRYNEQGGISKTFTQMKGRLLGLPAPLRQFKLQLDLNFNWTIFAGTPLIVTSTLASPWPINVRGNRAMKI